jgi:glycosyltransferase involved in cell wall biosynthesis
MSVSAEDVRIAVVIPAYKVRHRVCDVVNQVPDWIETILVVDDACPQGSGAAVEALGHSRVTVLRHSRNCGVGAATKTGFSAAAEAGCHIVVKIDGDGQMNPIFTTHASVDSST